ncbi:MAG: hypothetical protein P1Q69_12130 [Candidatus Thorarchaeota archaeon]|nr:hypothetical protein [Candidatus Thorarchaeota archaeon]
MQSMYFVGAAVLIVIVIMMILLAPSMRGRGYSDPTEEEQYERERTADMNRELQRDRHRWSVKG